MKSKKAKASPIGLAMLDIVSNGVAAVLILFFVMASKKLEEPPVQYFLGKVLIEITMQPDTDGSAEPQGIYVKTPRGENFKVDQAVEDNNRISPRQNMISNSDSHEPGLSLPARWVSQIKGIPHRKIITLNQPEIGKWTLGAFFVNYEGIPSKKAGANFSVKVFIIRPDQKYQQIMEGRPEQNEGKYVCGTTGQIEFEIDLTKLPIK